MAGSSGIKNRLAVVAYPAGRIGSSALMGLLGLCGLNLGRTERLIAPAAMNPKGFFELKSQQRFLCSAYMGFYPDIGQPPPLSTADEIASERFREFDQLLREEFGTDFPAAVKSPRCLTLPFLHRLRSDYDIRVLELTRDEDAQVNSILRVWRTLPDEARQRADETFVRSWLYAWHEFSSATLRRYEFPHLRLSFEELLDQPWQTSLAIGRFLGVDPPTSSAVDGWLDRTLVNREVFP